MDLPTQEHLTALRNLLQYRLHDLRTQLHAAELARSERGGAVAADVADRKDQAEAAQQDEYAGSQERRDADELELVQSALRRLDTGTYGDCADCSEPIALQRLLAQPAAERCAPCQTAWEHRRGRTP